MICKYFEILNKDKNLIKGDLRISLISEKSPLVIVSHGFKGFRNWGFVPYISQKIAENGFITINFDFSLNGIIDDVNQIYDDSIFRRIKVSSELDDLLCLIKALNERNEQFSELRDIWNGEIYLIGHSLGGAISVLAASKLNQISKISLWASVSKLDRNTERQKEIWRQKGSAEIEISTTGQKLHLDYTYIEDKDEIIGKNAVMNAMKQLNIPVQIIHPEYDLTVNIREAKELKSSESDIRKRLLIVIPKCGHVFNSKHPLIDTNPALEMALEQTILFFKNDL